jgi:hypothetical protein
MSTAKSPIQGDVNEKYEDLSGIKFWNGASYRVLDLFAPRAFAILAFCVCVERIIVLNGIWSFVKGVIWE